jgi:hypothetical protein
MTDRYGLFNEMIEKPGHSKGAPGICVRSFDQNRVSG